jgi:AmiR/NasT family two-component response regulator
MLWSRPAANTILSPFLDTMSSSSSSRPSLKRKSEAMPPKAANAAAVKRAKVLMQPPPRFPSANTQGQAMVRYDVKT